MSRLSRYPVLLMFTFAVLLLGVACQQRTAHQPHRPRLCLPLQRYHIDDIVATVEARLPDPVPVAETVATSDASNAQLAP